MKPRIKPAHQCLSCCNKSSWTRGWKQQKGIVSQFWRVGAWNKGDSRATFPLKFLGQNPSLRGSSGGSWLSLVCGSLTWSPPPPSPEFLLCVPFLAYMDTSIVFKAFLKSVRSHLCPYLNLICKDPISKSSHILRSWVDMNLGGTLFCPLHPLRGDRYNLLHS